MAKSKGKSKGKKGDYPNEQEVEHKIDKEMEVTDDNEDKESSRKRRDSKGSLERYEHGKKSEGGSGSHPHESRTHVRSDHSVKIGARHREDDEKTSQRRDHKPSQELYDPRSRRELNQNSRRSEPLRNKPEWRDNYRDNYNRNNQRHSFGRENIRGPRDRSRNLNEIEFRKYEDEFQRSDGQIKYEKVNEIEQDLFKMPSEYSLAHCVAEDMGMGSGIAVTFRYEFKRVDELLNQRQKSGGLAVLKDKNRYIYYLVTKKFSTGKPTYQTLFSSLREMKKHMQENDVTKLAMPRIGCGLDRLEWDNVKFMIEYIFKDMEVDIVICNLVVESSPQSSRHRNCRQVNVDYPIEKIEEGTIIVYLSSEDGHITEEMEKLDEKFHFLVEFRNQRKNFGDTVIFKKNPNFWVVGCIVKKRKDDSIDFEALRSCMTKIQKENKEFGYVGFQAIKDDRDACVNYKIINILRNTLRDVTVYICWPGDLQQKMSSKDRFSDSFVTSNQDFNRSYQGRDSRKDQSFSKGDDNDWRNSSRRDESPRRNIFQASSKKLYAKETDSDDGKNEPSTSQQKYDEEDWFEKTDSGSSKEFETPKRKAVLSDHQSQPENSIIDNSEYEKYKQEPKSSNYSKKVKIVNNTPNLPENYSQVCFVSEDFYLQSAIPSGFNISTLLGGLLNENQREGSCVFVKDANLYCLIVKKISSSMYKPEFVFKSIQNLKQKIVQNQVRKLLIPEMKESKKESFKWSEFPKMLEFVFQDYNIEITVAPFSFEPYQESLLKNNKVALTHNKGLLFQAKKDTMIIYWASEDGDTSDDMQRLSGTFNFLEEFKKKSKSKGTVIKFKQNEDHVLYGCVVKKRQHDPIDFLALQRCITIISDTNTEQLKLAAVSAVESADEATNYKIINILINNLNNVNISMCWPKSMREKMPTKNS